MPDLRAFRQTLAALCVAGEDDTPARPGSRVVIVPSRAAAQLLERTLVDHGVPAERLPSLHTRDELYDALHATLTPAQRRLTPFERDAMAQSAAIEASSSGELPFTVRPGLVAEIVRFYDQLRRQSQSVKRFEELIVDALGGGDLDDRGADRLLRQTRFLADTFRGYERRLAESGGLDEHSLRERLLSTPTGLVEHVIVTVPDWIADPSGLFVADFDFLSRLPELANIDIVSTEATLASGFHERLHGWWPGIDEVASDEPGAERVRPTLAVPIPTPESAPQWFTRRDREEELIAITRRLLGQPPATLDRCAVVYKRPLPYLYLAADTLGRAGIPWSTFDALPLAGEPAVAPLDLVLDLVESDFSRPQILALLRAPQLDWGERVPLESIAAFDRKLSDARFLGGHGRLVDLAVEWTRETPGSGDAGTPGVATDARPWRPALDATVAAARALSALLTPRLASQQLSCLRTFLLDHFADVAVDSHWFSRERRARDRLFALLDATASAHASHHDPEWTIVDLATSIRRWVGDETFDQEAAESGVRLIDDQAARYGEFDDMTIVGLIEADWPDKPRRNIFYSPSLLKALGWPSERDRHAAADARFLDLFASASTRVELSAFLLDDEAIVARSVLLDDVARARLSSVGHAEPVEPLLPDEIVTQRREPVTASVASREWIDLRSARTPSADPVFHGTTGSSVAKTWSVSALETYIGCPFKFFAQHVLKLEEEPDDEEVMDPRRQGQFVHDVFESFFRAWQDAGHRAVTQSNLQIARDLFTEVVDRALERLSEGEAALERTRLLGSSAAAGLGEAVFRMEAERPIGVEARLLEHTLDGLVTIDTDAGPRDVRVRGKADRLDLLDDGTFRLIDYKLGWPPDRTRALQLPVYAICAEQLLRHGGRRWALGEAVYLAFKGPRRVVPLFSNTNARTETLARAQQRLADTLDAIDRGEFPPSPDDVYRCDSCSFSAVCRKDYVGDV